MDARRRPAGSASDARDRWRKVLVGLVALGLVWLVAEAGYLSATERRLLARAQSGGPVSGPGAPVAITVLDLLTRHPRLAWPVILILAGGTLAVAARSSGRSQS